jgi:glutaredoxin
MLSRWGRQYARKSDYFWKGHLTPHIFAREDRQRNGVKFECFDVSRDAVSGTRMLGVSGGVREVPVIVTGDAVQVGYEGGS